MKLKSVRTNQTFKVIEQKNGIYKIELEDGSVKELAESTVKRWYKVIEEEKTPKDLNNQDKTKQQKTEPKGIEVDLVEKVKPTKKRNKSISNKEFKSKIALLLTEYIHTLDLKINKRKEYIGAYTHNKKKVVEIRSGRKGVKIAVRPMVFLMLNEKETRRCFYLNEKANMHFRTTMEINSTDDLELAKKLIRLSLKDLEG